MQKRANRILSALLVLVMVLSMLPATVFATGETDALEGWSIALGENIGVKFHLNSADYTVTTTVNGVAVDPEISEKVVTVKVAAAQMTDTIGLTVKNGEETVHTGEYSVREYAETILTGEYDVEVKEMVVEMLNYGAAAQTYFGYAGNGQANDGYELETAAAVPTEIPEITAEDTLDGISLYGMSLVFQSKTAVRFYFNVSGNISDYTFKVGETAYEPVEKNGQYYVEVGNINPQDLANDITLNVNDGALSVTYSPLNYIVRKYNSDASSDSLKALVQAMYGYHLEALDYQEYLEIIQVGTLKAHDNNTPWVKNENETFIYLNTDAYTATTGEYTSLTADAIKLVRGGEVYSVANPGQGLLVKDNDTQHLLKLTPWGITGGHMPIQAHDYFIIEGRFESTSGDGTTIQIAKSYIYYDGTNVEVSTTVPVLPTTVDAGSMSSHPNGISVDSATGYNKGIYFQMTENDAPITGWSDYYKPVSAENYKLVRDGVTYTIGNPGHDTILKYSATEYYLRFESWMLGSYAPITESDILIVEGGFVHAASKVTMNITKSYIYFDGTAWVCSDTEPVLAIDVGTLKSHDNNTPWVKNENETFIYFNTDAYTATTGEYAAATAGAVKLVRGGETFEVANPGQGLIIKDNDTQHLIKLAPWTITGSRLPLQANDYLIIEGVFSSTTDGTQISISKSYIYYNGTTVVVSATEPVPATTVDCGTMSEHADGWAESEIYFALNESTVPVDEDMAYPYTGNVKLVSDGETSDVNVTIYKIADGEYYMELEGVELADGDYLIVEGAFSNADNGYTLNITKTYVLVDGESLVYSETEPVLETEYAVTGLTNHTNGWSADGIYITHDAHAATIDSKWSVEYKPVSTDAIKLVRNGVTTSVGQPASGTLVVYGATEMYLKTAAWTIQGNVLPFVDGDQIIIEGKFKHEASGDVLVVEKTVICVNGDSLIFNPIFAGNLGNHGNGIYGEGIYAKLSADNAPANVEYAPLTENAYYVIRNGETINIGKPGRGTLVKYNNNDYFLKINAWCTDNFAYTTDDIIVIDGFWKQNTGGSAIIKIEKTYLYHNGSAWVCSAEAPAQKNVVDVVDLGSHGSGWSAGGFYFTAAANDAPYDGWSLRYKPVSADVIKCISGDTTTNVGNTGGETIVKYSDTEYYVEGWAVGSANMAAGNTFVIEGQFYNAANDVYIDVEKTYITLNADGSTTVITDSDKYINAGAMSAYTSNWFGDGIYFVLGNNIAPANTDWTVRYIPKNEANIKLVRGGEVYNIANTGAEAIVKIADGQYWLSLESWWWSAYAPIQDGDQLIIEGEFANSSNGYTLKIVKTYITFVSKADDNVVFSTAASTEFGDVLLPNTNETLTIGMWNGSYHVFEDKQLRELQAAGITKIMGIDTQWIGTTDVNAWLDRVYSYGISVIMDLRSWDGETVPSYASHPGVIGFLMYDEPCATEFDNLATLKAKFDAVMPEGKLFYVNLFPSCAAGTSLVGTVDWTLGRRNYDTYYVQKFLDKLDIEVLSWDNYSLLDGNGIRTDYFYNFEVMASKNVPMWYTMLSAGHGTTSASYATPTEAELRWQMAVALTYGVQNIDHYTYVSHEDGYSCMVEYETWEPTALYYDIVKVDNEYLAWDNIFMAYDWVGTGAYSANSNNAMLSKLENALDYTQYGLASVSASENLLVGVFDYNGENAYMVTNAGSAGSTTVGDGKNFSMNDTSVTLTLADGDYKCVAIIDNGEISYVALNADNTVTLTVEAYEGVFVIPVLN